MGLFAAVRQRYELVHADSMQLREEIFRLRYQVICCEAKIPGFEPEKYPQGRESDEFDPRSAHCLLRDRSSGVVVGSVRLVLADPEDPSRPFPTENALRKHFEPGVYEALRLPRRHTAEISRLILARSAWKQPDRARYAILGLLTGIVQMSARHGVTHWIAVMEPSLNRRLRQMRVDLSSVGPPFEHHGLRQVHIDVAADVLAKTFAEKPEVWNVITEAGQYWPAPSLSPDRRMFPAPAGAVSVPSAAASAGGIAAGLQGRSTFFDAGAIPSLKS